MAGTRKGTEIIMTENFEKFSHPYASDKSSIDLRSYSLKAADYINELARQAGAERERFVINALSVVRSFSKNHALIKRQVRIVEQRLAKRIEQRRRGNSNLPNEVFKGGVINTGRVVGTNIDAKLKIEHFSGNLTTYGSFGMGKTELNLSIIPQLIAHGVRVAIFDVAKDYRDLLQVSGCENGLVIDPNNDRFNPLEPIGSVGDHLQFFWEITQQDFGFRDETKEMLFNCNSELYEKFKVNNGGETPSLNDLKRFIEEKLKIPGTTTADKNKIRTALRKLDYIIKSFKGMADCRWGYSLDQLDKHSFVSYEIGDLSEDKRSWYMKLKFRQYQHKGLTSKERHKVNRIIVVDEAKCVFGKSRIGESTNYIKDMFTKSRSIGCSWFVSDQFATELASFTRAASCLISFQHSVPKEIREISTAMGCNDAQKTMIPQLGRYVALQKIAEYPFPYKIMTYKSKVRRHIDDAELKRLIKDKVAQLNSLVSNNLNMKKVRVIIRRDPINKTPRVRSRVRAITKVLPSVCTNPLEDLERFLKFVHSNLGTKLTDIYKALTLSVRKGDALKKKALDNGLIVEEVKHTGKRGRPTKELKLSEEGMVYIDEK
jgi:hypothetical protein